MHRQLPPLNALKAFEAAARHLSFTEAAEELHVTQGAISRQIKTLEEHYQIQLFQRRHRGLELTEGGHRLLPVLSEVFDRIQAVSEELTGHSQDLTIKVLPSFAVRWLIPRLAKFQQMEPDINVRLTTAWHTVDFDKESYDAGILHSHHMIPGLHDTIITNEWMTPVCSPELMNKLPTDYTPNDLKHLTLLFCGSGCQEWGQWCQQVGTTEVNSDIGQSFDTTDSALQAATSGFGIAMGDISMIEDDLKSGRLKMPFPEYASLVGHYHLVCPKNKANKPALRKFRNWLLSESTELTANNPMLKRLEEHYANQS
ncbi:transcriptional regulator GcvA [Kiloniella sp.]|uniref:transcriptional regulator GcvA n=1 Tax=Kiloniella sp. TaxID=1938587 RepID=UPI003B020B6F